MISKNFKVLEVRDDQEFVFDSFAFKASVSKYVADKKAAGEPIKKEDVKGDLAEKTFTSVDSITNWMYGRNGVSDLEAVKTIAAYLQIDYMKLLRVQEKTIMVENKEIKTIENVNMDKTKDVIRTVYQKMSTFMDVAADCVRFDYSQEFFEEHEHYYLDAARTLHLSLLDIPADIYKQLESILVDFEIYMYGFDRGVADLWDGKDYHDFLEEENLSDGAYSQMLYMQRESEKFYENIREILKDYITA